MLDGPCRDAAEAPARQLVVLLHGYGADGGILWVPGNWTAG